MNTEKKQDKKHKDKQKQKEKEKNKTTQPKEFTIANLHYAFNVEYYSDCEFNGNDDFSKKNKALCNFKAKKNSVINDGANKHFDLKTTYPGLLMGLGYNHGSGGKADIDCGFSFDYVTGLPYIPGSSIKGIVRNAFRHKNYIKEILNIDNKVVEDLEKEIFDGIGKDGKTVSIYNRDIFYDCYPTTDDCDPTTEGTLMAMEAITPHGEDITKNPIPLTLIKVRPGVKFKFQFRLTDSQISPIKADDKLNLIRTIILDFGAGAKTNVGFGYFL